MCMQPDPKTRLHIDEGPWRHESDQTIHKGGRMAALDELSGFLVLLPGSGFLILSGLFQRIGRAEEPAGRESEEPNP